MACVQVSGCVVWIGGESTRCGLFLVNRSHHISPVHATLDPTEDELNNRVVEHVAKTMKAGGKKGSILSGQNSVADNAESEMNSKGRAADMEADSRGKLLCMGSFLLDGEFLLL